MSLNDDKHIDVLQNIEIGIKLEYERNPRLTDSTCILALDSAKTAIKQRFGFAQNESVIKAEDAQGIIAWCVEVGLDRIGKASDLTLKEYVACLEKIKRSVDRHAGAGRRSYYEFIKDYVM
jgi:hypothetical protein